MDFLRLVWAVLMSYKAMQDSICYAEHVHLKSYSAFSKIASKTLGCIQNFIMSMWVIYLLVIVPLILTQWYDFQYWHDSIVVIKKWVNVSTKRRRNAGLLSKGVECDTLCSVPKGKYPNKRQKKSRRTHTCKHAHKSCTSSWKKVIKTATVKQNQFGWLKIIAGTGYN